MDLGEGIGVAVSGALEQLAGRIAFFEGVDDDSGGGEEDVSFEFLADEVFDWVYGTPGGKVIGEGNSRPLF